MIIHLKDRIQLFSGKVDEELKVTKAVSEALSKENAKSEDELKKLEKGTALLALAEKHTDDNLKKLMENKNFDEQLQKINEVHGEAKMDEKAVQDLQMALATKMNE